MDLKQQIDQLNEVINTFEANIETLKEKLKDARIKRRKFLLLEEKAKEIISEEAAIQILENVGSLSVK